MNNCRICCSFSRQQLRLKLWNSPMTLGVHSHRKPSSCHQVVQLQYSSKSLNGKKMRSTGEEEEEDRDTPYSFSTSRAAKWSVDKSFGSQYSRPLWKVAPLSVALAAFVAWIFLRSESELDKRLEVTLREHLPDLYPPSENESQENERENAIGNTR